LTSGCAWLFLCQCGNCERKTNEEKGKFFVPKNYLKIIKSFEIVKFNELIIFDFVNSTVLSDLLQPYFLMLFLPKPDLFLLSMHLPKS